MIIESCDEIGKKIESGVDIKTFQSFPLLSKNLLTYALLIHFTSTLQCYQQVLGAQSPPFPRAPQDKLELWEYFVDFWNLTDFMHEEDVMMPPEESNGEPEEPSERGELTACAGHLESILDEGYKILEKEGLRLNKVLKAFEAEEAFMIKLQPEDHLVGLNINGKVLRVSLRVPQCFPDSVLAITFDRKRWTEQKEDLDESGNYMMEHDPYGFKKVGKVK